MLVTGFCIFQSVIIFFRDPHDYWKGTWSTENCTDPKKLYEELIFSKEEMIEAIYVKLPNGMYERHTDLKIFNWTNSSRTFYGKCYHLHIFQMDIKSIRILPTKQQTLEVFVHDDGLWKFIDKTSYHYKTNTSMRHYVDIEIEALHMLDYLG